MVIRIGPKPMGGLGPLEMETQALTVVRLHQQYVCTWLVNEYSLPF